MRFMRLLLCSFWLVSLSLPVCVASGAGSQDVRDEEEQDYYERWLRSDVVYIITPQERDVFESLTTPEEKEQFIEQFWFRRDTDPRTEINEFKEEHYRRIAYANEYFYSGLEGWKTDRGRIYIMHGPPVEIEAHPAGGPYTREIYEGGGRTETFPFEIWRYRDIQGIGANVELEFVDPSMTNEYHLALNPEEKDALFNIPDQGKTLAEEMGLAHRSDRPFYTGGNVLGDYPMMIQRAQDDPFERWGKYVQVMSPESIKYRDLMRYVDVDISYESIPIQVGHSYFSFNEQEMLVPVTVQFDNKSISFLEENGVHKASLSIYGIVTSLTNRVVEEFEDDVELSYLPEQLMQGLLKRSVYQKTLIVPTHMRHKIDIIMKDKNSPKVGVVSKVLIPPKYEDGELAMSSLVLCDTVQILDTVPQQTQMFVLGDVKARPRLDKRFFRQEQLGLYLQLYNVDLDQSTYQPSLRVRYRIIQNGQVIRETIDTGGGSVHFYSTGRVVLIKRLHLRGFEIGKYTLEVAVTDRISGRDASVSDQFEIVELAAENRH